MTARIEQAETAGGTRTRRPATLTGTRRTYDFTIEYRPLTMSSCEGISNANAMREARARESREEGETRRQANADAMREARAREGVSGRRRDLAASPRRRHEGGASEADG